MGTEYRLFLLASAMLASRAPGVVPNAKPGPFKVGMIAETVLRDAARNKDLAVKVFYPETGGKRPVVVFSHGGGGSKDGNDEVGRHFASHGFVALHPEHADALPRDKWRDPEAVEGMVRRALTDVGGWLNRPRDVSFLLDRLPELERRHEALRGRLDLDRIGAGGHSYGAFTAQAVGGAVLSLPGRDQPLSLRDERVKAVLGLSPQGPGQMGLTETSWERFEPPYLVVTGTRDKGAQGQPYTWRLRPFELCPPGGRYLLVIDGANHMTFNGAAATRMRQVAMFELTLAAAVTFFKAHLTGDQAAVAYLAGDRLPADAATKAEWRRK